MSNAADQIPRDEFANFLTHGTGFLLSLAGAAVLIQHAFTSGSSTVQISCWIYALALVGVYGASTLSHSFSCPMRRRFFRALDQGMIFLFIAGNFTPVAMVYLHGGKLWLLMAAMWGAATVGFCSKVFWAHRVDSIIFLHYIALAWLPFILMAHVLQTMPAAGIIWVAAGGICYTLGIMVLVNDHRLPYLHAVWHLLVIAGSFCHFQVVVNYVLP